MPRRRASPAPKRHEIHPAIGAPLWWAASFIRRHWRAKVWIASLVLAFYTPYLLHEHSTKLDDARCDRIAYAAHVAYQYGCHGRDCSPDKEAYEQTVQMLIGSVSAGCHAPAPIRPDEAVLLVYKAVTKANDELERVVPPESEQILAAVQE